MSQIDPEPIKPIKDHDWCYCDTREGQRKGNFINGIYITKIENDTDILMNNSMAYVVYDDIKIDFCDKDKAISKYVRSYYRAKSDTDGKTYNYKEGYYIGFIDKYQDREYNANPYSGDKKEGYEEGYFSIRSEDTTVDPIGCKDYISYNEMRSVISSTGDYHRWSGDTFEKIKFDSKLEIKEDKTLEFTDKNVEVKSFTLGKNATIKCKKFTF